MTAVTTLLQQQTISDTTTSWSQTLEFAQFDPSLGTLSGVAFGLTADVTGSILLENLDHAPASFGIGFSDNVSLLAPGGATVASASPSASAGTTLTAGGMTMLSGITGSASDQHFGADSASGTGFLYVHANG